MSSRRQLLEHFYSGQCLRDRDAMLSFCHGAGQVHATHVMWAFRVGFLPQYPIAMELLRQAFGCMHVGNQDFGTYQSTIIFRADDCK